MRIASSPVLIRFDQRRQVVLEVDYNLKNVYSIRTLTIHETPEGYLIDSNVGVSTNNPERARHTFMKQWAILSEQDYVFDPEWNYE